MIFKMPSDFWGNITPRKWQSTALPKLIEEYSKPKPMSCIVRGVPRSGKSKLMAQMAACCHLEKDEVIVVSTPTIFLVEQLLATFRERLDIDAYALGESNVGAYYSNSKDVTSRVIIACTNSCPELADKLMAAGRRVALWLPDECHKTKCATICSAYTILNPFASCGFSGTPYRAKETESLHLFEKLIVNYKPEEALKDGVVVPFRPVFWEGGDSDLDSACLSMTELAKGPGLYNSVSIADAEVFASKCLDAGVSARPIHSQMSDADKARRIEEWRSGEVGALVHVNMLSEGCDFPWLRWICLRRPCGSRVRYVQELSRVLSSFTDPITGEVKDEAVVYDPQGIIKNFKLDYKAVLAGDVEDEDIEEEGPRDEKQSDKKKRQFEQLIFEVMREIVNATAGKKALSFTPLAAYLYELVTAFDTSGLIDRKIANKNWREKPVSQKQIETATKMLWAVNHKSVPKPHQKPLNILAQQVVKDMDRGMASDLLTIMMALANHKKWPDLKILDRSAAESMRSHNKRTADLIQKPITTPQIKLVKPTAMPKKKDAEPSLFDPFAEP